MKFFCIESCLGFCLGLSTLTSAQEPPNPPVLISCQQVPSRLAVKLSWWNDSEYDSLTIYRDDKFIETIEKDWFIFPQGSVTDYLNEVPSPGQYRYSVFGTWEGQNSTRVSFDLVEVRVPPVSDLSCEPRPNSLEVELSWTNNANYETVKILRDGEVVSTPQGSISSFFDEVPEPGRYSYEVIGNLLGQDSEPASCKGDEVEVAYVPPLISMECSFDNGAMAHLTWILDDAAIYTGIKVFIDNSWTFESILPGNATSYTSKPLAPGWHSFSVQPFNGPYQANPLTCSPVCRDVPMPANLQCTLDGLAVTLTWTNDTNYESVKIYRDGRLIDAPEGSPTSYSDPVWWPGLYKYTVSGMLGGAESLSAECSVPVVAFKRGDADGNGKIDLTDAIHMLRFLFMGGASPGCEDAADSDDSGQLDMTDAIVLLQYQFLGGLPPAAPGPETCGLDPTPGDGFAECFYENC